MPHARLQRLRREGTRGAARGATGGGRRDTEHRTHGPARGHTAQQCSHTIRDMHKGPQNAHAARGHGSRGVKKCPMRTTRSPSDKGSERQWGCVAQHAVHAAGSIQRGPCSRARARDPALHPGPRMRARPVPPMGGRGSDSSATRICNGRTTARRARTKRRGPPGICTQRWRPKWRREGRRRRRQAGRR